MVRPSNLFISSASIALLGGDLTVLLVVQGRNSSVGVRLIGKAHEAEATAAAGVAVFDHNLRMRLASFIHPCWSSFRISV